MIRFDFHPTPNPAKVALFLEESRGLTPVDTSKGEQHQPSFRAFPACPFGQSFSMLGFDTAEQSYV